MKIEAHLRAKNKIAWRAGCLAGALAALTCLSAAASPAAEHGLADFRAGRFAEALHDWQEAAAAGDPGSALYVGVLYDSGTGVPQDSAQAMRWYRQAADAGSAAGAFNVGVLYDAGQGAAKDPAQAAAWYDRAARRGFARAQYNLAMLYQAGSGVARNTARAIALYTSAARQGISAARDHLAALGHPYTGPAREPAEDGMQDFRRAQDILLSRGTAQAGEMAVLFQRAAARHNALAEYDLAYCYEHGMGVTADRVQAAGWYGRAATDAPDGTLHAIALAGAAKMRSTTGAPHQE